MKPRLSLYPDTPTSPSQEGLRERGTDASGIEVQRMLNLSTPIVSVQDGPRMSGKISNFGGHKAAPFKKGGKRRAKVLVAKAAIKRSRRKG